MESERETVAPAVCWKFSAAFSTVGSGRKRGQTLLETHNENSAPTTTAARKIESLGKINCVIGLMEILPETVSKGPKGLTNLDVRAVDNSASEFFCFAVLAVDHAAPVRQISKLSTCSVAELWGVQTEDGWLYFRCSSPRINNRRVRLSGSLFQYEQKKFAKFVGSGINRPSSCITCYEACHIPDLASTNAQHGSVNATEKSFTLEFFVRLVQLTLATVLSPQWSFVFDPENRSKE